MEGALLDQYHRPINYLRLSVTDRCNLRCIYCMSEKGVSFVDHGEILTYEEMLRIVKLCVRKGIRKVRVTGGEPLVRRGIIPFLERLGRIQGLEEISLTTNGIKLKSFARDIRRCGICRINISMDTLRPERFHRITRRDLFKQVWEGIEEAAAVGLYPLKINVVAMCGINDDEILDFARLTYEKPFHIRFIEKMPVDESNAATRQTFLSTEDIVSEISTLGTLRPLNSGRLDGPARRFALKGAAGEIGFIGALSHEFCDTCNRLRLTADGQLRGCLFSDRQNDLKTPLRQGKRDEDLLKLITNTILNKPGRHALRNGHPRKCVRTMNSIGG
jgi:cyclic pyranopterin phosphate synthase